MADIIDIDVFQTVTSVSFEVEPNTNIININKVTSTGGGGGGGVTNLSTTQTATDFTINSDTGDDALVPLGNGTLAGATLNNYTTTEKNKLAGIASGAEVNVNADWNATSGDAQILNKPTLTGFVPYTGATTNVDLGEYEIKAGQVTLDITPTGTAVVGTTQWNDALGSSETTLKGGTVILKNGVDLVARVVNKVVPNTTLTKAAYQAVRVSGATGQRLSVELAQGDEDLNSADTIGLVTETIATNQEGFIITMGQIENINTTGSLQSETWVDGDVLYLSPTVAGRLTNIKPTGATGHIVVIGYVEYAHAVNGKIYVKIMNGWELDELHNVFIDNALANEGLFYETSTQLWKNKPISTVLGYTPANDASVVHLTGSETIAGTKTFSSNIIIPATGSELILSVGSGGIVNGLTTTTYPSLTELTYVKGVTSAIQTQLNSKQASSANLTGLSALSYSGFVPFVRMSSPGVFTLDTSTYLTSVGIANLTATGTPSATTYLRGDNTWATVISGATNLTYTPSPTNGIVVSDTGTDATLPLADGTNAGLLKPAKFTVLENTSGTNTGDQDLSNLVVKNADITAATNTKITYDAKGLVTAGTSLIATDIPTITQAQVTNLTTDLAAKAPLASPTFTGTPSLPTGTTGVTQTAGDNTTKLATTAFVTTAVSAGGITRSLQEATYTTNKIATVTAAEYAALTKDANTLYFITA